MPVATHETLCTISIFTALLAAARNAKVRSPISAMLIDGTGRTDIRHAVGETGLRITVIIKPTLHTLIGFTDTALAACVIAAISTLISDANTARTLFILLTIQARIIV